MVVAPRPRTVSWTAGSLLLVLLLVPAGSAQSACLPEECIPIVPFHDVPYLTGDVAFERFEAHITVRDAVARTAIALTLSNDGTGPQEVEVALPLPDGAAILGFNLTIGDLVLVGRVVERAQAQAEYDDAVEQGRDAALLRQADKRLVALSLNVGPGEERVLRAAYAEAVPLVGASRVYRLPLGQLDPLPQDLAVSVDVASRLGASDLKASGLAMTLQGGKGSLATAPTSAKDLVLTWREEAGTRSSLVAAAPMSAGPTEVLATLCLSGSFLARDVVFILDQSGSMAGLKMEEGRQSLVASLATVTSADQYSVVPFSDDAVPFTPALVPGTAASVQAAQAKAAKLDIEGGTNIDAALQEAFRQLAAAPASDRLPMVVLMTDGLPTVGVTDHEEIIQRARDANTRDAPIIVVPIGLDADYTFLAHLALRSGGFYVDPGAPDAQLSDRLARLADVLAGPVAADGQLTIDGADPDSIYPKVLPPVYAQECLEVRFRTTGQGPVVVRYTGTGADGPVVLTQTFQPGDIPTQPAVRNLWGQALVADLLAHEAGDGSLRAAIIANATLFGLLTPYTSWVLVDDSPVPEPQAPEGGAASVAGTGTGAATGTGTGAYYSMPDQSGRLGAGTAASKDNKTPGLGAGLIVLAIAAVLVARRR